MWFFFFLESASYDWWNIKCYTKNNTEDLYSITTFNYQSPKLVLFITHFWWASCLGHKRPTNDASKIEPTRPQTLSHIKKAHCDFWLIESIYIMPKTGPKKRPQNPKYATNNEKIAKYVPDLVINTIALKGGPTYGSSLWQVQFIKI